MKEAFEWKSCPLCVEATVDPMSLFAGQSLWRAVNKLGLLGQHKSKAINNITDAAVKMTSWLWFKQGDFISHSEKSWDWIDPG